MDNFDISNLRRASEFSKKLCEFKHIYYEIAQACGYKFCKGSGSYLFDGQTYEYCDKMYEKQELLYELTKNVKNVLEIGTYMGHSLLIMLISNPVLNITCIDIDDTFTRPAISVLQKHFPSATINFIHANSLDALRSLRATDTKFDFFHVDGHHENDYITLEFMFIRELNFSSSSPSVMRVLFDDQECLGNLQKDIETSFKVIRKMCPQCSWNNVYYELQI